MSRYVTEKRKVMEFDLRKVSAKKQKRLVFCLKALFLLKKHILPLLYPNSNTLIKKKKSFSKFLFFEGAPRP